MLDCIVRRRATLTGAALKLLRSLPCSQLIEPERIVADWLGARIAVLDRLGLSIPHSPGR